MLLLARDRVTFLAAGTGPVFLERARLAVADRVARALARVDVAGEESAAGLVADPRTLRAQFQFLARLAAAFELQHLRTRWTLARVAYLFATVRARCVSLVAHSAAAPFFIVAPPLLRHLFPAEASDRDHLRARRAWPRMAQ